jgi:hypothetical protein
VTNKSELLGSFSASSCISLYLFIEKPVKSTYNETEHLKEKRKKEDTNYNKLNQQRKRINE